MGKHNKEDQKANKVAYVLLKKGDMAGAAAVLRNTSKENQEGFINRVKRIK